MVLMYFIRGGLPWQGLPAKTKEEKYEQIKVKKAVTSIEDLTMGQPKEFRHFLNYARKLKFEERPDYQQVISMFREAFVREGFDFDFMYDWILKKQALKARLAANQQQQQQNLLAQRQKKQQTPQNLENDNRYKGDNKYVTSANHSKIRERQQEAERGVSNIRDVGNRDFANQEQTNSAQKPPLQMNQTLISNPQKLRVSSMDEVQRAHPQNNNGIYQNMHQNTYSQNTANKQIGINLSNQKQQSNMLMVGHQQQYSGNFNTRLRDSGAYNIMNATSTSGRKVFRGNSETFGKMEPQSKLMTQDDLQTYQLLGQNVQNANKLQLQNQISHHAYSNHPRNLEVQVQHSLLPQVPAYEESGGQDQRRQSQIQQNNFSLTTPGGSFFNIQNKSSNQLQSRNGKNVATHDEELPDRPNVGLNINQMQTINSNKPVIGRNPGSQHDQRDTENRRHASRQGINFAASAQQMMDANQAGAVPHPQNTNTQSPLFPTMSRLSGKRQLTSTQRLEYQQQSLLPVNLQAQKGSLLALASDTPKAQENIQSNNSHGINKDEAN